MFTAVQSDFRRRGLLVRLQTKTSGVGVAYKMTAQNPMLTPPSTGRIEPVTNFAAGDVI